MRRASPRSTAFALIERLVPCILSVGPIVVPSVLCAQETTRTILPPAPMGARALPLPPAPTPHLVGFERRRAQGRGVFVDRRVLGQHAGQRLSSVLRTVPGVELMALGRGRFAVAVRGARHPHLFDDRPAPTVCLADILLDGVRLGSGAVSIPMDIDDVVPANVVALEFHRAPGIPIELAVGAASCGVLALWSGR